MRGSAAYSPDQIAILRRVFLESGVARSRLVSAFGAARLDQALEGLLADELLCDHDFGTYASGQGPITVTGYQVASERVYRLLQEAGVFPKDVDEAAVFQWGPRARLSALAERLDLERHGRASAPIFRG